MSQSYARGRLLGLTLLVAALVASSVPGAAALLPDGPAQARAAAGTLTANPGSAIAGEEVELEGKVTATARRKVVLQRQKGSSWVKVDSRTSTKSGRFDFSTRARATTTTYRVQAPAAGGMSATTTRTRTVKTVGQTASLSLAGSAALGSSVSATATFAPARPGRQVQLQRQSGASWITVVTAAQSPGGTAVLPVDTTTAGTRVYRVVTTAADGAPATTSSTRSITITGTVVPPPTPSPDTTPPGAVTGLSVTGTTTTSITLSWTNPGDGDLAGVMIRRAAGSTPPSSPTAGTLVTQKTGTSHTDSGLSPSTQYAYAVFAYDEVPNYSAGATTTATTSEAPDTTPPGAVTGLSVTGTTTTSITLSWTNPGDGDLAGVMIRRAAGSTPPSSPTAGTLVTQKTGTSHTDSGLSPSTQYAYAVFAYDEVPNYSAGASTTGTTQTPPPDTTPPGAVTGLSVTGTTTTSITLSWTNPGDGDLAGVMIRRAAGSTPPSSPTAGTLVTQKTGTSHTDSGLSPSTQYAYAVFAYDEVPNYSAGASTTGTTQTPPPDTTPPGAVTGLSVTGTTTTSITLSWTNPGDGDLAGVMIRRAAGSTPPSSPTAGTLVTQKTGTSHTDSGLSPSTQYAYAVFAYDEVPNYSAGATTTATTSEAPDTTPPGPVTGVGATKTATTVNVTWANPGAADFAGVVIRRALGPTAPTTPTGGTAVTDVAAPGSSHTDTGLSPSTQYSYALFAHDEVPNHAAAATVTVTTDAATAQEWTQPGRDAGHTGWSPDEKTITPANGASVGEEFSIPGTGSPAIAGGLLYTTGTTPLGPTTLAAYDLATAQQSWQVPTNGTCQGPVAVTATLVIVSCAGTPRAYDRGGSHAVQWDVAETDPGQSVQYHLVLGTTLVAWTNTRVAAYRLSDGQKLWQQLLPSGASSIYDVAAAGSTVVVAYDDRTRALGLTTGSQVWVRTGLRTSSLVIAGDWVYLHDVDEKARQIALATGFDGWTATVPSVVRIVAADADTVYVWEAEYDFSAPSPSILHALKTSDGTERWQHDVPSRIGSVAVTGDLVWLTSTGIYSQEHASDLIALKRSDGAEVKRLSWDDNMYGWTGVAFGAGKVVIDQGGSFGGPPRFLRVFGLAGPVPVIADRVVPLAYVGTSYSRPLAAQGVGPMSWSVVSGQLPAGMSLSGAGVLSGTPTVAGTARVRLQVTGGNGRSSRRFLSVQAVQTGTPGWGAYGRDGTRNPFEPSVPTIDADSAPTLAYRWKTAAPGTSTTSYNDPVTVGNRLYEVGVDGVLRAWDNTGSTTNRAPVWNVLPATDGDPATGFTSTPVVDGTRLIVLDQAGYLNARSIVDGAPLWRVASDLSTYPFKGVLVTGTTILGITHSGGVKAYSVADGSPMWGGTEAGAPTDFYSTSLSTDGTLVYTVTACELYAIRVSNGTTAWHTPISADPAASCGFLNYAAAPVVVGGVVYAATPSGMMSAEAATGAPLLRIAVGAYGAQAVVGGVWLFSNYDSDLHGIDAVSGELLWRYPGVGGFGGLAVSRDLIIVQNGYGGVIGVDRVSGEQVWDGGSSGQAIGSAPAIGSTRFFASQADGVHAFGPL